MKQFTARDSLQVLTSPNNPYQAHTEPYAETARVSKIEEGGPRPFFASGLDGAKSNMDGAFTYQQH